MELGNIIIWGMANTDDICQPSATEEAKDYCPYQAWRQVWDFHWDSTTWDFKWE